MNQLRERWPSSGLSPICAEGSGVRCVLGCGDCLSTTLMNVIREFWKRNLYVLETRLRVGGFANPLPTACRSPCGHFAALFAAACRSPCGKPLAFRHWLALEASPHLRPQRGASFLLQRPQCCIDDFVSRHFHTAFTGHPHNGTALRFQFRGFVIGDVALH